MLKYVHSNCETDIDNNRLSRDNFTAISSGFTVHGSKVTAQSDI